MTERKDLTPVGTAFLIAIMLVLALNQVVIKLTNEGLSPVFAAGLRSAGSGLVVWIWMRLRGQRLDYRRETLAAGLGIGLIFTVEFVALFLALDHGAVSRVSVIFYSMPVWMALAAHFLLPGERLTALRSLGLILAFAGVAWAILDRSGPAGQASILSDLAALLAALCWMGASLFARVTPLSRLTPEMQMFWQLSVSAPIMLALAPLFGPVLRDFLPLHVWLMLFQIVVVGAGTFLAWFFLLRQFKASAIASFAFLSPVFGVAMGWLWLGEVVTWTLVAKLVLVAAGIVLINRRARA